MRKQEKDFILAYLKEEISEPRCELNFSNPFELLISVILSAQCTDKRVNETTKILFERYKNVQELSNADIDDVEHIIKKCGLYKAKAKHIIEASKLIVENYNGKLPRSREDMMKLSGVGQKTANVVCSNVYGDNYIAVDTHVKRVANRLNLANSDNPIKVEECLTKEFKEELKDLHHRLVLFGRYKCKAKNPLCNECKLKDICKYYKSAIKK